MEVEGQAGNPHYSRGAVEAQEEEEEVEEVIPLLMAGTKEVVAGWDSQQPVVGEVVEGQQNQGEVEKMGVKAVGGALKTQILQEVKGVEHPRVDVEVEVEVQVVEQIQVWDLVEELVVGGSG